MPIRRIWQGKMGGGTVKTVNLYAEILHQLMTGPCTREQLCAALHVPRTTAYDALERLLLAGDVTRANAQTGRRGRPRVLWAITPLWEAKTP
jgi:predicted transcriptional regulator